MGRGGSWRIQSRKRSSTRDGLVHEVSHRAHGPTDGAGHSDLAGPAGGEGARRLRPVEPGPDLGALPGRRRGRELGHEEAAVAGEAAALGARRERRPPRRERGRPPADRRCRRASSGCRWDAAPRGRSRRGTEACRGSTSRAQKAAKSKRRSARPEEARLRLGVVEGPRARRRVGDHRIRAFARGLPERFHRALGGARGRGGEGLAGKGHAAAEAREARRGERPRSPPRPRHRSRLPPWRAPSRPAVPRGCARGSSGNRRRGGRAARFRKRGPRQGPRGLRHRHAPGRLAARASARPRAVKPETASTRAPPRSKGPRRTARVIASRRRPVRASAEVRAKRSAAARPGASPRASAGRP